MDACVPADSSRQAQAPGLWKGPDVTKLPASHADRRGEPTNELAMARHNAIQPEGESTVGMTHRSVEEYDRAVRRAAEMMAGYEQPDGTLTGDASVFGYYTRPMFYRNVGDGAAAMRCLNVIKREFMGADGSLTVPDAMAGMRPYPATWLTVGATTWGRFDVSAPVCDWLCSFRHEPSGGFFGTVEETEAAEGELECQVTGAAGIAALFGGRIDTAVGAGEYLLRLHKAQPDLGNRYFIRCRSDGDPIIDFGEAEARTSVLVRDELTQGYWWFGLSIMLLSLLHLATRRDDFVELARQQYDWAIHCHEDVWQTALSHKLCAGAALLYQATGSNEYLLGARRIADYLTGIQREDGTFPFVEAIPNRKDESLDMIMDIAAQFGTWIAMTRWLV